MKHGSSSQSGGADLLGFLTTLLPRFYAAYQANLAQELATLFVPGSPTPRDLAQTFVSPALYESLPAPSDSHDSLSGAASGGPPDRAARPRRTLDIWEAMRRFPLLALVGPPGVGKTTLLKHLAWQCASDSVPRHQVRLLSFERCDEALEHLVPVYLPLADSPTGEDLLEGMARTFADHGFPRARRFLQGKLVRGECLLLFDGLSQIPDERERRRVMTEIVALAERYGRNQIVVAARTLDDLGLRQGGGSRGQAAGGRTADGRLESVGWGLRRVRFGVVEHGGFSDEAAREFVRRWSGAQGGMGGGLLDMLEQSPGLSEMTRCPLCLTALVAVTRETRFPRANGFLRGSRLTPVLDQACQALLEWPPGEHTGDDVRTAAASMGLLEDIAGYLHERGARVLMPEELSEATAPSSPEAALGRAASSHLLQPGADGGYRFAHPAWQAYFAARALLRRGGLSASRVLEHAEDPWWQDVIAFAAGRPGRSATGREQKTGLPGVDWRILTDRKTAEALFLAARCAAEAVDTDADLRDEILDDLLAIFQQEEPALHGRASWAVAGLLGQGVSEAFPGLLRSGPVERRAAAAMALGRIGGDWAVAPLREALWDGDWQVRQHAARALGRVGGAGAVQRLVEALGDPHEGVRASAVEALVALQEAAVPWLMGALRDRRPFVSEAAADALRQIGPPAISRLIEALGDEREQVRERARDTLAAMGEPALEPLGQALHDRRPEIGRMAVATLGLMNSEPAAEALIEGLGDDRDAVWKEAMATLRAMGPLAVRPLIAAAKEESRVSERATIVLGEIGRPALEDLFEAIGGADRLIRWAAARVLGTIGRHHDQGVIARLQDLALSDPRDDVRHAAVEALTGIGDDRVVPALVAALKDQEKFVRQRAAEALRAMGTATVVARLRDALQEGVKADVIIELLGAIRTHEAQGVLRDLTRSADAEVAEKAALALEGDTSSGFYFFRIWESRIEEHLFTRGRFTTRLLKGVPDASREVVLQRYIESHGDENLEYDAEEGVLELRDFARIRDLIGHDTVQNLQDGENLPEPVFAEYATRLCHALCERIGLARPRRIQCGRWLAFVIEAGPVAFGTRLPETLPILFLHRAEPDPADLADLRHLLPHELRVYHKTALLVHLKDEPALERIKQAADGELRAGYAFDVIVLGTRDIQRIMAARDPAQVLRFLICDQADLSVISPYSALGPAEPPMFFGRDLEIKQITQDVDHTSVAVLGGRRIGKTSVLRKVARVLGQHYRCLDIDCHPLRNYQDLFKTIGERWPDVGTVEADPLNFYSIALAFRDDKPVLFLLDEVDALLEFDLKNKELLFKTLRKLFNEGLCRFIFSGDRFLYRQLRYGSELGLFNFCGRQVVLEYLDPDSARKLVTEPMARMNIRLRDERDVVQMILTASCCHPRLVQYICHTLITHINQERVRQITPEHVRRIVESSAFKEEYLTTLWGSTTPLEKIITLLLVLRGGPAVTIPEIQKALETWDIPCTWADLKEALDNLGLYSLLKRDNGTYSFVPSNFIPTVRESHDVELLIYDLRRQL